MVVTVPWRIKSAARILLKRKSDAVEIPESSANDPTINRVLALKNGRGLRINVGCGTDYHEGWMNIDGSTTLPRVDKVLKVPQEPLDEALGAGVADYILASDVIEHLHHWEAVQMMGQLSRTLKSGGGVEIRVPDCEFILNTDMYSIEDKLEHFYGGQDVPQGRDEDMDKSRIAHPEFFCHRYGWTMHRMRNHLLKVGFTQFAFRRAGSNFVTYAVKG
jgi:predicted SAM-dependent methyltransferase